MIRLLKPVAKTAFIVKMHFKCQVDTVLILTISTLAKKFTKSGKNALLVPAYYLGTIYAFFLVSFDEMQKLLQGQESYVYREMEYNRFIFFPFSCCIFGFLLLTVYDFQLQAMTDPLTTLVSAINCSKSDLGLCQFLEYLGFISSLASF